jgi:hypothetical protein
MVLQMGFLRPLIQFKLATPYSTFVPVVIVDDAKLGTEDGVSGLLGMSFLSRYDVKLGKDSVELRNRF